MADLKISELAALASANLAAGDFLPVADVSASETKKITVTDFTGKAVTLIADATIPGAKILFGTNQVPGTALVDSGVTSAKLASDSVTAAKLANESTVNLVTTLPASGEFTGQLALDTDNLKVYCWDGTIWQSIKAAGSINTVTGSSTGVVNISVTTSGDTVTIATTLDSTTAAGQFLGGPASNGGSVSYRNLVGSDLPAATASAKGGVIVSGEGLRMDGDRIEVNNDVTANTTDYYLVRYTSKGLVTAGRDITGADLPPATSTVLGGVKPGSGLSVAVDGTLNHSSSVTAGTATKLTFNAQGHITGTSNLLDTDIPNLPASKITTGTFTADRFGTNSITGNKLANASTVKFGGAGSTAGIVTFPTAEFQGQYFFDARNGDLYLYDGSAWQPITITAGELIYAGTYSAATNTIESLTAAGAAAGLTVNAALPAGSANNLRYYVVVSESGTGISPAPVTALAPPDMLVSNGATWDLIDVSNAIAGQIATNISFTPYGNITATNVQTALQELDDEKLAKTGGTITGNLEIGSAGSLTWEGSSADSFETLLTVVNPTADRTITLPNASGTVTLSGAIVNADISASAAIAGTKIDPNFGSQTITTTGVFSGPLGTATDPMLTFTGDSNTGIYSPGANELAISTGGVGRLFISTTGQVGIGTVSPERPLHVYATTSHVATIESNQTSATIRYTNSTGNTVYAGSTDGNNFYWSMGGSERARIDSFGRLLVGTSSSLPVAAVNAGVQLHSLATSSGASLSIARYNNDVSAPQLILGKSRSGVVGSAGIVQTGDFLGEINFAADDGTDLNNIAASIVARVDGTPGTGDMPGRIVLSTTADGAATPTEQWRISNGGIVVYNQPAPAAVNTTATLTVANLTAKIITSTTAAAVTMTLPTGTDMDAGFGGLYNNMAFEWSVINTGATNAVTVQGGTGHTVVGSGTVAASNSGRFLSRRTATTTWVTYRLAS